MADSHPFANAGLGMFGSAERQFTQMGMSGPEKGGLAGKLGAYLLDKAGIKDFLDNLGKEGETKPVGVAPSSKYSIQPVAPMSPQGINPMRLPNAMPGGVGLNAMPAGVVAPMAPRPAGMPMPDDDHANQVLSSWG